MFFRVLTLTALLATAMPISAQQRPEPIPPPALNVNGNGDFSATPDEAIVRLGIVKQGPTAQQAQEQANGVASAILNGIARTGVPASDVQTARLTLTPIYERPRPGSDTPRIIGYNATNTVSVRLDDLSKVGPVIDAGLNSGANQLEGVRFGLKNDLPAREEAMKRAVAEAKRKAEVMAEALNVRLAGVLEVHESGVSVMAKEMYAVEARMAAQDMSQATPVAPGEVQVRANVSIRYRIENR